MLRRTLLLSVLLPAAVAATIALAFGGCATDDPDPEPATADATSASRCDPFCDDNPGGDDHEEMLQGAYNYGYEFSSDAVATGQSCSDLTGRSNWDCLVTFATPHSDCQGFFVECLNSGGRLHCHAMTSNCSF
jgi:hypothetical protein